MNQTTTLFHLKENKKPLKVIDEDLKKHPCDYLSIAKKFVELVGEQITLETRIELVKTAPKINVTPNSINFENVTLQLDNISPNNTNPILCVVSYLCGHGIFSSDFNRNSEIYRGLNIEVFKYYLNLAQEFFDRAVHKDFMETIYPNHDASKNICFCNAMAAGDFITGIRQHVQDSKNRRYGDTNHHLTHNDMANFIRKYNTLNLNDSNLSHIEFLNDFKEIYELMCDQANIAGRTGNGFKKNSNSHKKNQTYLMEGGIHLKTPEEQIMRMFHKITDVSVLNPIEKYLYGAWINANRLALEYRVIIFGENDERFNFVVGEENYERYIQNG